jgi:nucleoside-diphosphate-sugar epimerase
MIFENKIVLFSCAIGKKFICMKKIDLTGKTIFITGVAGFIGANLAKRLLHDGNKVRIVGIDNMNDYYDVRLKEYRLQELSGYEEFTFIQGNIADKTVIQDIFASYKPQIVVNLAAQAGVRYSITNPDAYVESNLVGFYNILEACRHSYDGGASGVEHLVYASSSSVYGSNKKVPYSTEDKVDNPVSLYAATKKSNELLAHAYSKLYNIPSTGLRFFTVYGPAGRPDMAYFGFTNKLREGKTIQIFNYGNCKRDFTYVDDIVEGVVRVMQGAPDRATGEDGLPLPPYAVYNIGNNQPENLLDFVDILQQELIRAGVLPADYDFEAHKELVPMQPGDVPVTYADTSALERDFGFKPSTSLREGLRRFAEWYKAFYM